MADDSIVAEYRINVANTQKQLADLAARLGAVETQGKKSAQGVESAFDKMGNSLMNQFKQVGATIAGAFAIDRIAGFTKEAVMLAGKVEGVEIAFKRLNDPQLLNQLRAATKGTVSDLNLMTAAVRASNFKIPMEQMGTLLEFARRQAKEMGVEIDYLVESIVLGIGRKSPQILDNLGISAVELRKRFKGLSIETAEIGDIAKIVGDIAGEKIKEMGDEALTTGDQIAQLGVKFDNLKVSIGGAIIDILEFYGILEDRRPAQLIAVQRAEEQAQALARLQQVLKGLATDEEKQAKLEELRAKSAQNAADSLANLQNIEEQRRKLTAQITEAEQKAEAFRSGARQFKGEAQRAEQLREQLAALEKVAEAERFSLGMAQAYLTVIKQLNAEYQDETGTEAFVNNLVYLSGVVKTLTDELQLLPVYTDEWVNKFKELERANVELAAAKNLIENLKTDIEEPVETDFISVMADEMPAHLQYLFSLEKENDDAMRQLREQRIKDGLAELDSDIEAIDKRKAAWQAYYDWEAQQREEQRTMFMAIAQHTMNLMDLVAEYESNVAEQRYLTIDKMVKDGVMSEESAEKRKKQIAREQAKRNKEFAVFSAIINTAMAVVNALATAPNYIVGAIFSALAAVEGAIQIAAIEAQPLPQFGKGGWIDGKLHSQGGTMIEAEKGEFIINRKAALKHAPLLEAINADRVPEPQQGWDNLIQSIKLQNAFNDRNMISAIDRHREGEAHLLRELLIEVKRANGKPLRGGYHA